MWNFVKILLLIIYVESATVKEPLVVYIEPGSKPNEDDSSMVKFNEEKLLGYQTIFKVLMSSLHIEQKEQHILEKTLRSALKNRCFRLNTCKKSCSRSKPGGKIECKEECEREIDEEDLCGDYDVETKETDNCAVVDENGEKKEVCQEKKPEEMAKNPEEKKEEDKKDSSLDECEANDNQGECTFRAQYKNNEKRQPKKRGESSKHKKNLLVLLRHDKNVQEDSRKTQLDKAAIEAYFRTDSGKFLRSCLRECDFSKLKPGFECIQECKVKCKHIGESTKNPGKSTKKYQKGKHQKKFKPEKCDKNDYLCIYMSLVESNETKNIKGDLLTLIAGYSEDGKDNKKSFLRNKIQR